MGQFNPIMSVSSYFSENVKDMGGFDNLVICRNNVVILCTSVVICRNNVVICRNNVTVSLYVTMSGCQTYLSGNFCLHRFTFIYLELFT